MRSSINVNTLKALINAKLICATLIFATLIFAKISTNSQKLVSQKRFQIRDSQKLVFQTLMKLKNFRKS